MRCGRHNLSRSHAFTRSRLLFPLQKSDGELPSTDQIVEFENAVMTAERKLTFALQQAAQQAKDKREQALKAQVRG